MNPVSSKGIYAIRAHLSYQNIATAKLVELAIGVPPRAVVKTEAKPEVKPETKLSRPIVLLGKSPRVAKPEPPGVIRVRHILLRTKPEALQLIAKLNGLGKAQLRAGFIAAAESKSIGPSRSNGGDLGFITPGRMVAAFDRAAFSLNVGTMTMSPVKTGFGYHLIYREE